MSNRAFYGVCAVLVVVIVMLLTAAIPRTDHKRAEEAATTAKALNDLVSRTNAGITYSSFADRLGDARSAIDVLERDYPSDPLAASVESAYKRFALSREIWDAFRTTGDPTTTGDDFIMIVHESSSSPAVLKLVEEHPELKYNNAIFLHQSLSAAWKDASSAVSRLPATGL